MRPARIFGGGGVAQATLQWLDLGKRINIYILYNHKFNNRFKTNQAFVLKNCQLCVFDFIVGHIRVLGTGLELACNGDSYRVISLKRE